MMDATDDRVRLTLLGPVRAWRGDTEIDLGPRQVRTLLAILLAQVGRPVSMPEIVDIIWGSEPPASATNAVHGHVGTLRRALEPGIGQREGGRWLRRSAGGYQLVGDADSVDIVEFRQLVGRARAAVDSGRDDTAAENFRTALDLCESRPAGNISDSARGHAVFVELDQELFTAARDAADCALRLGQPGPMVASMRRAAERDPLDESLQARLILLLAAAGQQAQALSVYARVRDQLAGELGIDPGHELRAAYETVLQQRTTLVVAPPTTQTRGLRPAQLPADLPSFAGRRADLARAMSFVPGGDTDARTVIISAISGMAGVGKTTLAVHVAHQIADRYPDGHLYVNLRGFDPSGSSTSSSEALRGLLDALGVTAGRMPRTLDGQVTLYRSLLAGRRTLVVLDNARDAEQVRPLLPSSRGCLAIVTSRHDLAGLVVTHGAHPLLLHSLSHEDAVELLAHRLGRARLNAEPAATTDIVAYCAGLPLALAIVAARVAMVPDLSLAAIAAELRAVHGVLDTFASTDAVTDVRAVFSWSYHGLSSGAARLFRLLGATRMAAEVGLAAAASVAGLTVTQVRPLLSELLLANLIGEPAPGRYTTHDLLAAYAAELAELAELAESTESAESTEGVDTEAIDVETADANRIDVETVDADDSRRAAMFRLIGHYLHTAIHADRLFDAVRAPITVGALPAGVTATTPQDRDEAIAWFVTERLALVEAVRRAATSDQATYAWQLAWAMQPVFHRRGFWADCLTIQETALAAIGAGDDREGIAHTTTELGLTYTELSRHDEAENNLRRALAAFRELGDSINEGRTCHHLAYLCVQQDRFTEALGHLGNGREAYAAVGRRAGEANALNSTGWVQVLSGDPAAAVESCERALAIFREVDNEYGQAAVWDTLGYAHHNLGDYARASECYQECLARWRKIGNRVDEANALHRLGDNHAAAAEPAEARASWRQALAIMSETSHPETEQVREKLTASVQGQLTRARDMAVHRR